MPYITSYSNNNVPVDVLERDMIEANDHTRAVLLRAVAGGWREEIEEAAAIYAEHERAGFLSPELKARRDDIIKKLEEMGA